MEWTLIDIAKPAHQSILATEEETEERQQDLALEPLEESTEPRE